MENLIKNIEHSVPFQLVDLIDYQDGKVASLTLSQKQEVGITLFAFDKGEGINTHAAPGDAMIVILDGEAEITIDGVVTILKKGQGIVMPANIPHAVNSITRFKMILTLVKHM